uniref:Uncharacterized protein n=1 Tax=Rhizophora mucronata TaxID=61149 RepID=A0A2P2NLW1_RHIMU
MGLPLTPSLKGGEGKLWLLVHGYPWVRMEAISKWDHLGCAG